MPEKIQINSSTYIEVYGDGEGRYIKILHPGRSTKDRSMRFCNITGYQFDSATQDSYGRLVINGRRSDETIRFSKDYEKNAEIIKPYLENITNGESIITSNHKDKTDDSDLSYDMGGVKPDNQTSNNIAVVTEKVFKGKYGEITCYQDRLDDHLLTRVKYSDIQKTSWSKDTDYYCLTIRLKSGIDKRLFFNDLTEGNRLVDYIVDHSNLTRTDAKVKDLNKWNWVPTAIIIGGAAAFLLAFYLSEYFMYLVAIIVAVILILKFAFGGK